jgi:hypothetical protein
MNYFEDWYSQPIDNEEEDQEKRLASLLQAAAEAPTGGPDYEPQDNFSSASDQASFNPRTGTDLIQQILNRNVTDMNRGLGDTKDLPGKTEGFADLFERPAEAVDDLDFFDRKATANLFRDIGGSAGLDDDFWGGLQKGSGEVAEMPKINLAASDLLNWLGSDKNLNAAYLDNPAKAERKQTPDLSLRPEDYADQRKQWEAEQRKKVITDPRFDDPSKSKSSPSAKDETKIGKWYNSLNPKPTVEGLDVKIVEKGQPGSENGTPIPWTNYVVVPNVGMGVETEGNLEDLPGQIYDWIRKRSK